MLKILEQLRGPQKMRVVCNGHPALRKNSAPVENVTKDIRELAERMIVTMLKGEMVGVGLAAPQVGINKRMIVLHTCLKDGASRAGATAGELLLEPRMPIALINPEIVSSSEEVATETEGCLSLPGVDGTVTRPEQVVIQASTLDGESFQIECGGLLGRCFQHEIDHLNGVLFYDRLSKTEQKKNYIIMKKIEKQEKRRLNS